MSFNRIRYDKCAYDLEVARSTAPGSHRLFGPFAENCNQCISTTGPVGSKADVSISKGLMDLKFKDMADTESKLSWRGQTLTKCNDNKNPLSKIKVVHKPVCSNKLNAEDTRFTHPIDNFRSMSLTSYMLQPHLPTNPQCCVQESGDRIGIDTRSVAKDSFKPTKQTKIGSCAQAVKVK